MTLISSPLDMILFGTDIAKKWYKKIFLHGELGAGKTHFTKGFCNHFDIDPKFITSPTYTYLNEYQDKVLHIDMYRIESRELLQQKWILDLIHDYEYIIIERPKFTESYIDDSRTNITINKISETERKIELN